jgi:hypothetical protein
VNTSDLEHHAQTLGFQTGRVMGVDNREYLVIRGYKITAGSLAGKECDLAIMHVETVPYVPQSAIHLSPALLPMDTAAPLATQASQVGEGWQYLSRIPPPRPTPQRMMAHIATIFAAV